MGQINKFIEGVKKGKSYFLYKNTEWTFPAMNLMVTNLEDDSGYVIQPLESNGIVFFVKKGYAIIGAESYNGVLYIVSTEVDGDKTEIGVYPSPKIWSTNIQEYERVYKPLHNFYDLGVVNDLNTNLFQYTVNNEIEIIIKEIFDGSVNLYLCNDHENNLVINSGFNQNNGNLTGKTISKKSFNGSLNLIPSTNKNISAEYKGLSSPGALQPGMYYIYYRYVDKQFSRTKFIGETYPVQVNSLGDDKDNIGMSEYDINKEKKIINASINIEIDNTTLDTSYEYIEVAVIRNSADEFGVPIIDSYLINKLFPISDLLSNNKILINGLEDKATLAKEEVLNYSFIAKSSKTHTNVNSRYYGGNWKAPDYDKKILKEYAEKITVRYATEAEISDYEAYSSTSNASALNKLNDLGGSQITYNRGQYMRGEIVPFAVKFLLSNSDITEAFPVNGGDDLKISSYVKESNIGGEIKGLYRFPEISVDNDTSDPNISNILYPLGIKFDNSDAIAYYNNNKDLFNDVVGVFFLRGDKIENLIYQGIITPTTKKVQLTEINGITSIFTDYAIPFFSVSYTWDSGYPLGGDNSIPFVVGKFDSNTNKYAKIEYGGCKGYGDLKKIALFNADNLFQIRNKVPNDISIFIKPLYGIGGIADGVTSLTPSCLGVTPKVIDINIQKIATMIRVFSPGITDTVFTGTLSHIEVGSKDTNSGFTALVGDGTYDGELFYRKDPADSNIRRWNQSKDVSRYLGITLDSNITDSTKAILNTIANVYLYENNAAFYINERNNFNPSTKYYYEISKLFSLDDNASSITLFKGDSFNHRIMFRMSHAFGSYPYSSVIHDSACKYYYSEDTSCEIDNLYGHGELLTLLTENFTNIAMRNEVQAIDTGNQSNIFTYSFYPRILKKGITLYDWLTSIFVKELIVEASQLNVGYNNILSPRKVIGYDINRQLINSFSTRIFFSPTSLKGELSDAFRLISPIAYQDYNIAYGCIVKLLNHDGNLISVQENRINRHFLGQKKISQENSSSDIVLQDSGIYLSKEVADVAAYGSQHQNSIVKGEKGWYGVDFKKRIIWTIITATTQTGKSISSAIDISEKANIKGWISEVFDYYSKRGDIVNSLSDNPTKGVGITSGYNSRNKTVFFTFHLTDGIVKFDLGTKTYRGCSGGVSLGPNPPYIIYETIYISDNNTWYYALNSNVSGCFNTNDFILNVKEIKISDFIKFYPENEITEGNIYYDESTHRALIAKNYIPANQEKVFEDLEYYITGNSDPINEINIIINEATKRTIIYSELINAFIGEASFYPSKYFSINNDFMVCRDINSINEYNDVYLFGNESGEKYLKFFNINSKMQFSIIVTGGEKAIGLIKEFSSYIISSNKEEFSKIEFETDSMSAVIDPFIPNKWINEYIKPEYKEGRWHGSIPVNSKNKSMFSKDEFIKGNYLKIIFTFEKSSLIKINEIITNFIISNI